MTRKIPILVKQKQNENVWDTLLWAFTNQWGLIIKHVMGRVLFNFPITPTYRANIHSMCKPPTGYRIKWSTNFGCLTFSDSFCSSHVYIQRKNSQIKRIQSERKLSVSQMSLQQLFLLIKIHHIASTNSNPKLTSTTFTQI